MDSEAGLGGGVDFEQVGDGGGEGVAVEDCGWQKMFIRRASELLAESSSIHGQSLRARERREAVWGLVRRRGQSGLAQMAA